MTLGSKEHYDILANFEKNYSSFRLDKEPREMWSMGQVYQDGEANKAYTAFIMGYAMARSAYMNT